MYKNILLPVIFDEAHDTQAEFLAARALADEGAQFTILHVMEAIPSYAAAEIPASVFANTRADVDHSLSKMAEAFPEARTEVVSGHAGRTIVNYANEHDIDCIVVASHRPGLEDFFLGSTADRIVRHANCSVHVIR